MKPPSSRHSTLRPGPDIDPTPSTAPLSAGALSERGAPHSTRSIALEQQSAFLKAVRERSAASAIVGKDLSGRVVSWSDGARAVYGYEAAEMLGKTGLLLQDPGDAASGRGALLYGQAATAGKWEGRVQRIRKGGIAFPAQVTMLLRRDPSGKPSGLVVVSRDLSENERIERELAASRTAGAQILDSSAEFLLIADFAGKVWEVNPLTCAVSGRARSSWIGFGLQGKFREPSRVEDLLRQTLLQDEVYDFELALLNARGAELTVRCDSLALPGINGDSDRILITMQPLVALGGRRASAAPRAEMPGLASAGAGREPAVAFSTSSSLLPPAAQKSTPALELSHELRTPLNAIIGFAELMRDGKVGAVASIHREYLEDILTSAKHMQRLLNQELAHDVGLASAEGPANPVALATLAAEVRDALRLTAGAKRLEVSFELDGSILLLPEQATKVRQILYNYLSNALKFTPERGLVRLRCQRLSPRFFRIEVEDSGPGIAPEQQARLFSEFEQLDIAPDVRRLGTGLGLAICRRLAEALSGSVRVDSELGRGSVFSADLPLSSLSAHAVAQSERDTPESATRLLASEPSVIAVEGDEDGTLCA